MKANGGEKSLAWAKGDWVILVQAKGGQAPLVQAKNSRWLSITWCLLHDLKAAETDHGGCLGDKEAWSGTTGWCRSSWCSVSWKAKQDEVLLAWSTGGGGKPLWLSLIPEVGMASHSP